jgi:excisionase family DNA binding protein
MEGKLMQQAPARRRGAGRYEQATPEAPVKLHPIPEAAELLGGCSKMHVYRLIAAGLLRAVDIAAPGSSRSKTRIRSDDLAAYIEAQTRTITA